nr:MAG TPA: hypothetical protein [Caudoviricetes sp.]
MNGFLLITLAFLSFNNLRTLPNLDVGIIGFPFTSSTYTTICL